MNLVLGDWGYSLVGFGMDAEADTSLDPNLNWPGLLSLRQELILVEWVTAWGLQSGNLLVWEIAIFGVLGTLITSLAMVFSFGELKQRGETG